MKNRKASETAFVTISDTHVGSDVGLWPPGFRTTDHNRPVPQSEFQGWLWQCWQELPETIERLSPNAKRRILVINGDAREGFHHRSTEQMVHAPEDQVQAMLDCFELLRGKYLGTPYVADKLRVRHNGVNLMWRHHMSTTGRVHTEGTALRNEWLQEVGEAHRCNYPAPKILTMAHRHRRRSPCANTPARTESPREQPVTNYCRRTMTGTWSVRAPRELVRRMSIGSNILTPRQNHETDTILAHD